MRLRGQEADHGLAAVVAYELFACAGKQRRRASHAQPFMRLHSRRLALQGEASQAPSIVLVRFLPIPFHGTLLSLREWLNGC
jgi:hypothetical protein